MYLAYSDPYMAHGLDSPVGPYVTCICYIVSLVNQDDILSPVL
jgi:hypothetical protein